MINFIFMLTHSDSTIEDALDYVDALSDTGLHYIGFKDVGATPERQRSIAHAARDVGFETMLEVVSTSREAEVASVRQYRPWRDGTRGGRVRTLPVSR